MMMLERITKSKKEIVDRALDILKKHKGIFLDCADVTDGFGPLSAVISVIVEDKILGSYYNYHINAEVFEDQRFSNESKTLSFDDIIALRIAKFIFENYTAMKKKELSNAVNDMLTNSTNQTVQTLKCGSVSYDIGVNGRSLTAAYDDLDDARDRIKELEDKNTQLEQQLLDLQALLMAKGVL